MLRLLVFIFTILDMLSPIAKAFQGFFTIVLFQSLVKMQTSVMIEQKIYRLTFLATIHVFCTSEDVTVSADTRRSYHAPALVCYTKGAIMVKRNCNMEVYGDFKNSLCCAICLSLI